MPESPLKGRQEHVASGLEANSRVTSTFSICSYNVLADCYVKDEWYTKCPKEFLNKDYRHGRLMAECKELGADIFCMQEVMQTHFEQKLLPDFASLGYFGIFQKRSGTRVEGLAIFWRSSKFLLAHHCGIHLNELAKVLCASEHLDPAKSRLFYDTSALIVRLRILNEKGLPGESITVCTTHIYWDWKLPDTQSLQIAMLLRFLHKACAPGMTSRDLQALPATFSPECWATVQSSPGQPLFDSSRLLFCGDFNVMPSSAGYAVVSDGALRASYHSSIVDQLRKCPDILMCKPGQMPANAPPYRLIPHQFSHPFVLSQWGGLPAIRSAYQQVVGKEPDFTTRTEKWEGCLDYIWYTHHDVYNASAAFCSSSSSSSRLHCTHVLGMPSRERLKQLGGCPNKEFGSDHLSIIAKFALVVSSS